MRGLEGKGGNRTIDSVFPNWELGERGGSEMGIEQVNALAIPRFASRERKRGRQPGEHAPGTRAPAHYSEGEGIRDGSRCHHRRGDHRRPEKQASSCAEVFQE